MPFMPCWLCPRFHEEPTAIYVCRTCHLAVCAGSVFVHVGRYPLAHKAEGIYCGPVALVGRAAAQVN